MTNEPTSGVEAVAKIVQYVEDIMIDAEVDFPAGREAGPRICYDSDAIEKFVTATLAALATPAASPATPPEGYHRLPDGQVCKCIKSWTHADGSRWCCLTPPASPSPAPAAVDELVARLVKPLEWDDDGQWWGFYARKSPVGIYNVCQSRARTEGVRHTDWFVRYSGTDDITLHANEAEAKAAAQADYTARILSALDATALSTLAADKARIEAERDEHANYCAEAIEQRAAAEAGINRACDVLGDRFMLVPPDGGDVKLHEGAAAAIEALAAAEARASALEGALKQIASQKTVNELCAEFGKEYETDWEGGYDQCIATARAALSPAKETP